MSSLEQKIRLMQLVAEGRTLYKRRAGHSLEQWKEDPYPTWEWKIYDYKIDDDEIVVGNKFCVNCKYISDKEIYHCWSNPIRRKTPYGIENTYEPINQKNKYNNCSEYKESFILKNFLKKLLTD